jgi:hypothetical protein
LHPDPGAKETRNPRGPRKKERKVTSNSKRSGATSGRRREIFFLLLRWGAAVCVACGEHRHKARSGERGPRARGVVHSQMRKRKESRDRAGCCGGGWVARCCLGYLACRVEGAPVV